MQYNDRYVTYGKFNIFVNAIGSDQPVPSDETSGSSGISYVQYQLFYSDGTTQTCKSNETCQLQPCVSGTDCMGNNFRHINKILINSFDLAGNQSPTLTVNYSADMAFCDEVNGTLCQDRP